jgi:hypothetical protein
LLCATGNSIGAPVPGVLSKAAAILGIKKVAKNRRKFSCIYFFIFRSRKR